MSYQDREPYISQDPSRISQLVQALEAGKNKGKKAGFRCRKSSYKVDGTNDITIDSWKFMDWDYKRDDLPTYARGLFTYRSSAGRAEIVTRGYDKFFNIDEVNETKWRNIESNTKGPYELSVKENGCIIFLSGLEDGKLLVCSKHSTGARADADLSHAVAGERWVDKHLASVGKTKRDLAIELRRRNVTAVAELCDDLFEEHVLEYDEKSAGLYLHGVNINVPDFATYSGSMVHKFADEWGLEKAQYLVKEDVESVKAFLEKCAETGSFDGRDTEGFVVRCQRKVGEVYGDWFFKYKFEEPYLMYRQWREVTKSVIAGKAPRYKKHAKVTEQYLLFARRQLAQNPGLAKAYQNNHGIIKMRDNFLKEVGLKGSEIIRQEYAEIGTSPDQITKNVVLVPVATIGCGKTTVALGLVNLFDWGHVQNDNITVKKNRPQTFANQCSNALAAKPVVFADRNNHQKREREQLTSDLTRVIPGVKFVALHYVHHPKHEKLAKIRKATQARVLARGDNHQTIQAGSKETGEVLGIMEGFLQRFQPLEPDAEPDNVFDEIIDLDPVAESRQNLGIVIDKLRSAFPSLIAEAPTPNDLDKVVDEAMNSYTVDIKHDLSFRGSNSREKQATQQQQKPAAQGSGSKAKSLGPAYFALLLPATQIRSLLDVTFSSLEPSTSAFYRQLSQTRRLQPGFHITLAHRAQISEFPVIWQNYLSAQSKECKVQNTSTPVIGKCRVKLERVIWDGRVMCFVARMLDAGWESMAAARGGAVHVTVGTADPAIKPKESNDLVQAWERAEDGIHEVVIEAGGEYIGEVKAVFQ